AYRLDIYRQGLRLSSRHNQRIAWLEFGLIALVVITALVLLVIPMTVPAIATLAQVLIYHLLTMMLANASVGIIAVWGVHHDCDETIARTERNPVVNLLTFNLLYHVEHHLFPAVPSNHLPELAKRLDAAAPHLTTAQVVPDMTTVMESINNYVNKLKDKYHSSNDSECPIRKRFA
ncbi:fatty acid desaturase, partial [Psychrobacter sp. AOP29-E1-7]